MVSEHQGEHRSEWAVIRSMLDKFACSSEMLRRAFALKPHRTEDFKVSPDPLLAESEQLTGRRSGAPGDAAGEGSCPGVVFRIGLSDLADDLGQICVGFIEQLAPS